MRIFIIDPVCPQPYQVEDLLTRPLGGTEATVARVARELSKSNTIILAQRNRKKEYTDLNIQYVPLEEMASAVDIVITLRDAKVYREMRVIYPNARHYLWLHDIVSGAYKAHLIMCLQDCQSNLIAVSHFHKSNIINALAPSFIKGQVKIDVIYNPIEDYCRPVGLPYDPKKLIFYSSPHKGLEHILSVFTLLREQDPAFTLHIGNPGYYKDIDKVPPGVIILPESSRTHANLMTEVATSLCMFYPQISFEETFGLVYAEANAVGTPVITHNIGAASEILDSTKQLINCKDIKQVIKTTLEWSQGGRPTVSLKKEFTMSEVIKSWVKLLRFSR